jgi:hypothetical protein
VEVALTVLAPADVPSVRVEDALPSDPVVVLVTDREPPPAVTAKATLTPPTALLLASLTITTKGLDSVVPTVALWLFPENRAMLDAEPATLVALKVTGEPESPVEVAVTVLAPADVPSVRVEDALPSEPVVVLVTDREPPPAVTAKATLTPPTALLLASLTITTKGLDSVVPTVALWLFPENRAMLDGDPAVPVALKVTGEPERPVEVAVTVLAPADVPSVRVENALPSEPVVVLVTDREPPPVVTANVTLTPLTGLLLASFTITTNGLDNVVPEVALCPFPENRAMLDGDPATPVALNVTGEPERPVEVAATVLLLVPAVVPSVRVEDALPSEPVVVLVTDREPPPVVTANVTLAPPTALLLASLTITTKGLDSVVPTVALWLFPEKRAILDGGPAVPVALKVTGEPESPMEVAVTVLVPAVVPRVKVEETLPSEPVVALVIDRDPPPAVTANDTLTPPTALLLASLTITTNGLDSVVPTVAL